MGPKTLKELLLEPWLDGETRLFDSQVAIARAIASRKSSHYEGREPGLIALLNQILNQGRSCPGELRQELIAEVILAAQKKPALAGSMSTHELGALVNATIDGRSAPVTDLFLRQVQAKEVVVVNPHLELRGHPRAMEFQRATMNAILDTDRIAEYVFLLDKSRPGAILSFTEQTIRALQVALAERDQDRRRETVLKRYFGTDGRDEPRVRVAGVEPELCILPLVAFDAKGPFQNYDLYVWDWHLGATGEVEDHIAPLSPDVKRKWLETFYYPILQQSSYGI